jgi:hypothetical protein
MTRNPSLSVRALANWQKTPMFVGLLLLSAGGCSKKDGEEKLVAPVAVESTVAKPLEVKPSPEACHQCELSGACADLANGCSTLSGDARTACEAVDKCLDDTGCAKGDKSFTSCFCGNLSTDACLAAPLKGKGAPEGACAATMRTTMPGAASNHDILMSFQRVETALGAAITRRNCQKGTACKAVCGF